MTQDTGRIYRIARQTAGLTQERWAEALGVDPAQVSRWECGVNIPTDEAVRMMAEVSGLQIVCYWHLLKKPVAADLPRVERMPLAQATVQLLRAIKELDPMLDELLAIAEDGAVTPNEEEPMADTLFTLDKVVKAALSVAYAEGVPHV